MHSSTDAVGQHWVIAVGAVLVLDALVAPVTLATSGSHRL